MLKKNSLPIYVGDYAIIDEIGRGGMKVVVRAYSQTTSRQVALALLQSPFGTGDEAKVRFVQEYEFLAKLDHPNIVNVFEAGEEDGYLFFSMELFGGETLTDFIESDQYSLHRVEEVFLGICDGLELAHQHDLVHRDIKPSNILLDDKCVPKLTDFGLSKDRMKSRPITKFGQGIGTPLYAPPEQSGLNPYNVGPFSDVYSLAMTLLEVLLRDKSRFVRISNAVMLAKQELNLEKIVKAEGLGLNPKLQQFLSHAMAFDAKDRIQSIAEFRQGLLSLGLGKMKVKDLFKSDESRLLGGRFRLLFLIGKGGMGEVWKALDPHRDDFVVVKFLPELLKTNRQELERLKSSFRLIHDLHHEHICPVYDLIEDDELGVCLIMKFVEGIDLGQYCKRQWGDNLNFTLAEVCSILYPVAQALDYAHETKGILHRDVKLENIMLNEDGSEVVLVDFGIAERLNKTLSSMNAAASLDPIGTPTHMAPELWQGQPASRFSDQYALGVLAYEMLGQRPPFESESTEIIKLCTVSDPVPALPVAQSINQSLKKVLSKNPQNRFSSCTGFVEALRAGEPNQAGVTQKEKSRSIPYNALIVGITAVLALFLVLYQYGGLNAGPDTADNNQNEVQPNDQNTGENPPSDTNNTDRGENHDAGDIEQDGPHLNKEEKLDPNLQRAFSELQRGDEFVKNQQLEKALKAYTAALALCTPKINDASSDEVTTLDLDLHISALVARGNTHLKLKKYELALRDYANAESGGCENWVTAFNRGMANQGLNLWRAASKDFNIVINKDPKNGDAYELRGDSYFNLQEIAKAVADYEQAYELTQRNQLKAKIERCR